MSKLRVPIFAQGAISVVRSECLLTGFKILNSEDPVRVRAIGIDSPCAN